MPSYERSIEVMKEAGYLECSHCHKKISDG